MQEITFQRPQKSKFSWGSMPPDPQDCLRLWHVENCILYDFTSPKFPKLYNYYLSIFCKPFINFVNSEGYTVKPLLLQYKSSCNIIELAFQFFYVPEYSLNSTEMHMFVY
jgi:hypothetical protein